jgi:hypothetical protein
MGTVAPVLREKASGPSGCGAGDRGSFDNSDISASRRETPGDGSADNATTHDHNTHLVLRSTFF